MINSMLVLGLFVCYIAANCNYSPESFLENYAPGLYIPDGKNSTTNCVPASNSVATAPIPTAPVISQQPVAYSAPQSIPNTVMAPSVAQHAQPQVSLPTSTFQSFGSQQQYPQTYQIPNSYNTAQSPISPTYTQPPQNNSFTASCDNSMETDKFKACVANAIKSLKSIIANCKRTLGENAPECCVDEKCLDSLKKKKNDCDNENGGSNSKNRKNSLDDFLEFLQKEIKNKEEQMNRNNGNRRDNNNDRGGYSDNNRRDNYNDNRRDNNDRGGYNDNNRRDNNGNSFNESGNRSGQCEDPCASKDPCKN